MAQDFNLGRHEEAIKNLSEEVHALRQDVAEIKEFVASVKGGWKALAVALTTLGAGVGAVVSFVIGLWRNN